MLYNVLLFISIFLFLFSTNFGELQLITMGNTASVVTEVLETPSATTSVTQAPRMTAEPTPTPWHTPSVTLEPWLEEKLLNQQLNDFLNTTGDFTTEKMSALPIYPSRDSKFEVGDEVKLGLLWAYDSTQNDYCDITCYGYFFDYFRTSDDNIVLIVGFDNKDDSRFITFLRIVGYIYDDSYRIDKDKGYTFSFFEARGLHINDKDRVQYEAHTSDQICEYLSRLKNKKIALDVLSEHIQLKDSYPALLKDFYEESNKTIPYARTFIHKLSDNKVNASGVESSGRKIYTIDDWDDSINIIIENVPVLVGIRFRENS